VDAIPPTLFAVALVPHLVSDGELIALGGILLLGAIGASLAASRLRIPPLLLYLAVGVAAGAGGAGWLHFNDYELAQRVGIVALALILFEGGLKAGLTELRPVLGPALALAVGGTVITAVVTGLVAAALFGLSPLKGLLLGSIMASTDSAAVFGLLRGSTLRRRLVRTLEGESGFNDPIAVILVLGFIEWLQHPDYTLVDMFVLFGRQILVGAAVGYVAGRAASEAFVRMRLPVAGLYPVASFAVAGLAFGTATALQGSGFLAVYLAGLSLAGTEIPARQTIGIFHEGVAWVAQLTLFVMLGLLVVPSQLGAVAAKGILLGLIIVLVARPIAVIAATVFDRFTTAERLVLVWAGLRGAVPVVFATFPVVSGIPGSIEFFNIVFIAVVVSTLLQGPTFEPLARALGLTANAPALPRPLADMGTTRGLGAEVLEYPVLAADGIVGRRVAEVELPNEATLTLIVRGNEAVPPRGSTRIKAGDTLYLVVRQEVAHQLQELFERWRDPVWAPLRPVLRG
jgi:cell volume regulation protein A